MSWAKVIADSTFGGIRASTLVLRYPRIIHSEFMTHRAFSRNASSSRAIPTLILIMMIFRDMAFPVAFGANKPGMQAGRDLKGFRLWLVRLIWRLTGYFVACMVRTAVRKSTTVAAG